MEYLSANEIAKKWEVSKRTVTRYAANGKIKGAYLVANTWMIPADTKREDCIVRDCPVDGFLQNENEASDFHFPLYLYRDFFQLKDTLKGPSELKLYTAFEKVLEMKYDDAYSLCKEAMSITENTPIIITCLYVMARCSLYINKYNLFMKHVCELNQIFATEFDHKQEMKTLLIDIETYYKGFDSLLSFSYDADYDYNSDLFPIITTMTLYKQILISYKDKSAIDTTMYEMVLKNFMNKGYIYPSILLGSELALIFYDRKNYKTAYHYAITAYKLANENNGFLMLTDLYSIAPRVLDKALKHYGITANPLLKKLTKDFKHSYIGLMIYLKKPKSLYNFNNDDFEYIYYAINGLTNKEIAADKNISENAVTQKYSKLYRSFNVNSKKELVEAFINSLGEY